MARTTLPGGIRRVLVKLVGDVGELGGKPFGDRMRGVGLLDGEVVGRPVETLGPPAADGLLELGPVGL